MNEDDNGFTLVEVMVSLALFVLVAGAATFAIVSSIRTSDSTNERVAAGYVAQVELDRVRALGPNPVATAQPLSDAQAVVSGGRKYTVSVKASPDWSTSCFIGSVLGSDTGYRALEVIVSIPNGRISPVILDSRIACGAVTS